MTSPRPDRGLVYLRRTLVALGVVIVLIWTALAEVEAVVTHVHFATVLAMLVASLPILWAEDSDPFSPLSYTAFYLVYGYFGIFANFVTNGELALPHLPLGTGERSRIAVHAIAVNATFFLAYSVAFLLARRRAASTPIDPRPGAPWSRPRLLLITAFAGLVFLVTYAEFQRRLGLPLFSLSTLREGKAVWRDDPALSWMMRGTAIGFIPIILYAPLVFRSRSKARIAVLLGIAGVMSLMVVRLGQRGSAIYPLIAIAGIFHYTYRRIPWRLIVAAALVLVVFSNASSRVRTYRDTSFEEAMQEGGTWPMQSFSEHEAERSRLDSTAIILFHFPRRQSYLLGQSWLPILVALVPRWVWPEKVGFFPYSDGGLLKAIAGLPAPTPLPALLYANFGYFGIPFGGMLVGLMHASLYTWLLRRPEDRGRPILYLLVLVFFSPTPLGVGSALQYVLPAWLSIRFLSFGARAPDHAAPLPRTTA